LERKSNTSNVYLVETFDFLRINQLIEFIRSNNLAKQLRRSQVECYVFDVQQQTLRQVTEQGMVPVEVDVAGPFSTLDGILRSRTAVVIIKYVFMDRHALSLADPLLAWANDPELYGRLSSIIVFTADHELFPSPLRRIVYTLTIPPSTEEERRAKLEEMADQIMEDYKAKYGKTLQLDVDEALIQASAGLNLHDVESAACKSFFQHRRFTVETFTQYKIAILRQYGLQYILPDRGFESVGGYDGLKSYLNNRLIKVLRNPELAQRYGLAVPRGILLYGYPGCGKTWLAKALAKEIGLPMIALNPADFMRGIVGETEARVRQITQLIETMAPVIVFIDEIDQFAMARERQQFIGDSGVSRRMQNMLLEWLGSEHRRSFIVGATNFVEHMDFAFLRAGRVDEVILVLPPDRKAREEILKVHTQVIRKVPYNKGDFNVIADSTYMWTGAELEKLVRDASFKALEKDAPEVTEEHFLDAMHDMDVNIQTREDRVKTMIQSAKRLELVNRAFLRESLNAFTQAEQDQTRISALIDQL
jgi:AAA+ superfamily predicted ATPase